MIHFCVITPPENCIWPMDGPSNDQTHLLIEMKKRIEKGNEEKKEEAEKEEEGRGKANDLRRLKRMEMKRVSEEAR